MASDPPPKISAKAYKDYGYGGGFGPSYYNPSPKASAPAAQEPADTTWFPPVPQGADPSQFPTVTPGGPPGYLDRPARKQASGPVTPTHSGFYNIWYHRVSGDYDFKDRPKRSNAPSARCNIKRDAGRTKGDSNTAAFLCLYFARGQCHLGGECSYLHRRPTDADETKLSITHDVFGRDRHLTDRDDMGGVGSFSRDNRTLYIGGLRNVKGVNLEEEIIKAFSEWGDLEYVRVIHSKSIAFCRYRLRGAAEFAKEAMGDSSFGHDETLNIRWANEDPNPAAKLRKERETQDKGAEAILEKWGSTALWEYTMPNPTAYPATDGQYAEGQAQITHEGAEGAAGYDPTQVQAWQQYYANLAAADGASAPHTVGEPADGSSPAASSSETPAPAATVDAASSEADSAQRKRAAESAPAPAEESNLTKSIAQMINATIKKQKKAAKPAAS